MKGWYKMVENFMNSLDLQEELTCIQVEYMNQEEGLRDTPLSDEEIDRMYALEELQEECMGTGWNCGIEFVHIDTFNDWYAKQHSVTGHDCHWVVFEGEIYLYR